MRLIAPAEANPHAPSKPQPPPATREGGLHTSNNNISLWPRTPCRGGVYKYSLHPLTWKKALKVPRRIYPKRFDAKKCGLYQTGG